MDRDNLWTRRSSTNKSNVYSSDSKTETNSRSYSSTTKRFPGLDTSLSSRANGVSTANTASPGASSAFGLGSGAFASFGSSAKTPKTPGTAFDPSKSSTTTTTTTESDKQPNATPKPSSSSSSKEQSSLAEPKAQWPLKYTWVLWYRPPTSKTSDYEKSIKAMYKIAYGQDFWKVYSHLKKPSALPTVSEYHFFKGGIRPVWEDEENCRGGKWILRLKKGVIDRYWEDLLLAAVGDQFAEAGEEVCGMIVSVRSSEDVLSIWTRNNGGRNVKIRDTIKRALSLPADTAIIWKSHDDSIAQRSAIEQSRLEKGTTDKRRNTLVESTSSGKEKSAA